MAGKKEELIAPGTSVDLPIRFTTGAAQESASGAIQVGYRKVSDPPDSRLEYVMLRVRAVVTAIMAFLQERSIWATLMD